MDNLLVGSQKPLPRVSDDSTRKTSYPKAEKAMPGTVMEDRFLRSQAERCAPHIGAAEELDEAVGVSVYVYYEPHRSLYEHTKSAVRSRLGDAAFEERVRMDPHAADFVRLGQTSPTFSFGSKIP
jgi:hypothetical protein